MVEGIEIYGAQELFQVVEFLNSKCEIPIYKANIENLFNRKDKYLLDFSEVKGQENVKKSVGNSSSRLDITCLFIGHKTFIK